METITDIIQCPICLETFSDPRILPCIHTFCLKCLQEIVLKSEEQQPKGTLHCPICRIDIAIPEQGVESFQKNFFMHRLKEITMITKPLNKSCDMCLVSKESDDDEILPADIYCIQCHKNICRRCCKIHNMIPEATEHQLIQLGTEIMEDMIKTISHEDCPRHKKEQAKMYCSDCKKVICVICFAENHQTHKCSGVENVGNSFRQELKELANEIETCVTEQGRKRQQYTKEKTNFLQNVENVEQSVIRRKNELIALIDKCSQSLLEELASIRQTRLKEIQNDIDEIERQQVIIESFKSYCKQIEEKGTNNELCQVVPTLKCRAEEIKQTHRTLCQQSAESIKLHFEETNFEKSLKTENVIARIEVVSDSIRSIGKLDIPSSSVVYGVTKLENKICVLCEKPNVIRVFNDQSLYHETEIDIKQIKHPFMMVSSEKSKCLFVIQYDNDRIWKITPDDRRVTEWLTDVGRGPASLSVTSEGLVMLITFEPDKILKIYDSDSQLICHFPLPSNICNPQLIIRKPNGEFIISHREGTDEGPWTISRLTSDGQTVIGRFSPKDKTEELNEPLHLALDSDNDQLFVADLNNDRVIILHPDSLNLLKMLLTNKENGISEPYRLFYGGRKKQLIVGQWPNKVDVFEYMHKDKYA